MASAELRGGVGAWGLCRQTREGAGGVGQRCSAPNVNDELRLWALTLVPCWAFYSRDKTMLNHVFAALVVDVI
jgi:hypothetical protein